MTTNTIKPSILARIPKRLRAHVTDIYRDCDGLWIEGDKYFWNPILEAHTVHEDTWAQAGAILRNCVILNDGDPNCID